MTDTLIARLSNLPGVTLSPTELRAVPTGRSLWSEQFDAPMDDIFTVQDQIARHVVDALAVTLTSTHGRMPRQPTLNPYAYQAYVSGLYKWQRRLPEAVQDFEEAVRADPSYALAWSGLANALAAMGVLRILSTRPGFFRRRTRRHCGHSRSMTSWRRPTMRKVTCWYSTGSGYATGEECYRRAIQLRDNVGRILATMAIVRAYQGRVAQAIRTRCWVDASSSQATSRARCGTSNFARDPLRAVMQISVRAYAISGRVAEARREVERLQQRGREGSRTRSFALPGAVSVRAKTSKSRCFGIFGNDGCAERCHRQGPGNRRDDLFHGFSYARVEEAWARRAPISSSIVSASAASLQGFLKYPAAPALVQTRHHVRIRGCCENDDGQPRVCPFNGLKQPEACLARDVPCESSCSCTTRSTVLHDRVLNP